MRLGNDRFDFCCFGWIDDSNFGGRAGNQNQDICDFYIRWEIFGPCFAPIQVLPVYNKVYLAGESKFQ